MVIKGGSFEEACQTLRALKKAFVINNVSLSEQLEQIFKNA